MLRSRAGFTFSEIMMVLAALGVLSAVALVRLAPGPQMEVDRAAREMRAAWQHALVEAAGQGRWASFQVEAGDPAGPRFLVWTADGDGTAPAGVPWSPLPRGVHFGAGVAVMSPFGGPVAAAAPAFVVHCTPEGECDTGPEPLVYYLSHASNPSVVRAVSLEENGLLAVHTYEPSTGSWK